jgi:hypothetical protein
MTEILYIEIILTIQVIIAAACIFDIERTRRLIRQDQKELTEIKQKATERMNQAVQNFQASTQALFGSIGMKTPSNIESKLNNLFGGK